MKASNIKGALLEYLVRRLLASCGFTSVMPDNLYTYVSGGLFYINGRGAAHDADVLMEPPVQMPFSYPSRILFECKAYESKATLPVVRNALGLKYDINEFEIVTKDSLLQRKNNRRAVYAIEHRKRYNYQVGVASAANFSKPAIEFAANSRLPLLSLEWFLNHQAVALFQSIDQQYVDAIDDNTISKIYDLLKDREQDADRADRHQPIRDYLRNDDTRIGRIIAAFDEVIDRLFVGLLESGDLIFIIANTIEDADRLQAMQETRGLKARFHYSPQTPDLWHLSVGSEFQQNQTAELRFFLPEQIMGLWKSYSLDRVRAIQIKGEFFSRIFVFNRGIRPEMPFLTLNIDREWFNRIRDQEEDNLA